jgi:hypothetical protein
MRIFELFLFMLLLFYIGCHISKVVSSSSLIVKELLVLVVRRIVSILVKKVLFKLAKQVALSF